MSDAPGKCEFKTDDLSLRLDMCLPADVTRIGPIVDGIMAIVGQMRCADGHEVDISVALREALANAVVHGAQEDPSKEIQVCVSCDEKRGMLIIVRDPGPGFDPEHVPSPIMGEQIFAESGRGIYLINELMDEVRFEKNGTEIWMRKR